MELDGKICEGTVLYPNCTTPEYQHGLGYLHAAKPGSIHRWNLKPAIELLVETARVYGFGALPKGTLDKKLDIEAVTDIVRNDTMPSGPHYHDEWNALFANGNRTPTLAYRKQGVLRGLQEVLANGKRINRLRVAKEAQGDFSAWRDVLPAFKRWDDPDAVNNLYGKYYAWSQRNDVLTQGSNLERMYQEFESNVPSEDMCEIPHADIDIGCLDKSLVHSRDVRKKLRKSRWDYRMRIITRGRLRYWLA